LRCVVADDGTAHVEGKGAQAARVARARVHREEIVYDV
jgi:hypothetical protein